jgi:hypothetical protein
MNAVSLARICVGESDKNYREKSRVLAVFFEQHCPTCLLSSTVDSLFTFDFSRLPARTMSRVQSTCNSY